MMNALSIYKPVLIVLAGRTYPEIREEQGDYDDWIAAGLGDGLPHIIVDARDELPLPDPSTLSGVVVSGSHAMVTDREDWSERLGQWLKTSVEAELPVLGICYGHQLLADAFGGQVASRSTGIEIGTRMIELMEGAAMDDLFSDLPRHFPAQLVHYQSVVTLPDGATVLACSADETHQAFHIGKHGWGVQFHPEFSADAMRGYIDHLGAGLPDSKTLRADIVETPEARSLLRRFAILCGQQGAEHYAEIIGDGDVAH